MIGPLKISRSGAMRPRHRPAMLSALAVSQRNKSRIDDVQGWTESNLYRRLANAQWVRRLSAAALGRGRDLHGKVDPHRAAYRRIWRAPGRIAEPVVDLVRW